MLSVTAFSSRLPDRLLQFVENRQTATRAFRDQADDETVVAALLHDICEILSSDNHAGIALSGMIGTSGKSTAATPISR